MREGSDEYEYKYKYRQNAVAAVVEIDENFRDRESYLEGRFSDEVDCSLYDKMMDVEDEHEDKDKDEDQD
jgi:hypothetical protein